jgi:hypothetical protein
MRHTNIEILVACKQIILLVLYCGLRHRVICRVVAITSEEDTAPVFYTVHSMKRWLPPSRLHVVCGVLAVMKL